MNAREFLKQAYALNGKISKKYSHVTALRNLVEGTSAAIDDMPHGSSPCPQRMENVITEIVDLEREIDRDTDRLIALKQEIISVISQLPNPLQRDILNLRYIAFKSWIRIAGELHICERWARRSHNRAVYEVEQLLK